MDIFKMFFGNIFQRKGREYRQNLSAGIRRRTVGRVQAKATNAMTEADRKILGAQNRAVESTLGGNSEKKGDASASSKGEAKMAERAQGGQAQRGAQGQNTPKGKGSRQRAGGVGRPGVNPLWSTQKPSGARPQAVASQRGPAAQAPAVNYQDSAERTVGIDIRGLEEESRRHVVGWIVAQTGNHRGMDFRLFEGKNVVGTAANCDIVITDAYLSARHCTIRYDNGDFIIIDLDSRNGTFVNQKKISKYDLIDNDTVKLGKSEFKFKSLF